MTNIKVGGARRSRTVVIAVVTAIALVAVVLVAYQLGRSGGGASEAEPDRGTSTEKATATPSGSETTESGPESATDRVVPPYMDWSVPPTRVSALPASTEQVEGYEVGFPGTTLGAVAWTVASYEAMTRTSPDGLTAAATAYYPEEWTGEAPAENAAQVEENVASIVDELGYSDGAELSSEVFGYSVLSEAGDRVVIGSAVAIRATDGDKSQIVYGAIVTAAEWDGERWNGVVEEDPTLNLDGGQLTTVRPSTPEFNQEGWYAIDRENWT